MISVALMRDGDDFQADMDSVNFFIFIFIHHMGRIKNKHKRKSQTDTYTHSYILIYDILTKQQT